MSESDEFDQVRFFEDEGGLTARIPLDDAPELASRIGLLIAYFACVELTIRDLIAKSMGISQETAQTIVGPVQSLSTELDILEGTTALLGNQRKDVLREIVSEIRWANSERNRYAHSQFASRKSDEQIHRIEYFTDAKRTTKRTPIDNAALDAAIERMRRLICRIWLFVTGQEDRR